MDTLINLTGQRFGRYTVIERAPDYVSPKGKRCVRWKCQCDCGTVKEVNGNALKTGNVVSCGCYAINERRERMTTHGATRNRKSTHLYSVWDGMKERCYNRNKAYYHRYGGRGITMCDEWHYSFEAFQSWAYENGYREDLTIDRIDNDKGYCPENCRWVTIKEQSNNKENNHYLTFRGETKTLMQWSEATGFPFSTLSRRASHWKNATAEEILLTPRKIDKNGHRAYVQSKLAK